MTDQLASASSVSSASSSSSASGLRQTGPWARRAVLALAFLLCGGVILARVQRLAAGGTGLDRALSALQAAGAEVQDRAIPAAALTRLEPHPHLAPGVPDDLLSDALDSNALVLLNFWATWCPPCIDELASMRDLATRLNSAGVQVVAVSYDEGWPEQMAALKRNLGTPMPTPILWARDPEGQDGDEFKMMRTRFGTRKLPETYVLAKGRVLARFVGEQDWGDRSIERALLLAAQASQ